MWDLSATYHGNPLKWAEVLGANPFLKEKGRVINHPDGRVIVLIRPGEKLAGLEQIGVQAEMIPFSSLWPASASTSTASSAQSAAPAATDRTESIVINLPGTKEITSVPFYLMLVLGIPLWFLILAAVIVLAAMYVLYKNGLLFGRDPAAAAGPPIIHGGIPASQPAAIEDRFERIAERRYGERNPQADLAIDRPERIGTIESGFLSGIGTVQYRDHTERRRLNREPAYCARFRFPDGTEEDLYFLQQCANDVRLFGTRYHGFLWEPEWMIVSVPATQPAQATQTAPSQSPASSPPAGGRAGLHVVASVPPVMTTVAVGEICVTIPEGSSVQIGKDGRISIAAPVACEVIVAPTNGAQQAEAAKTA